MPICCSGLILLSALRGQHGKTGSGFASRPGSVRGRRRAAGARPSWWQRNSCASTRCPAGHRAGDRGRLRTRLTWTPSHLFLHVHGGLREATATGPTPDAALPRPPQAYFRERSIAAGSRCGRRPTGRRAFLTSGVNPLRDAVATVVERVLWPKLTCIVAIDTRISTTGMRPICCCRLRATTRSAGSSTRRALTIRRDRDRAVAPPEEAKPEWRSWPSSPADPGPGSRARLAERFCHHLRPLHGERSVRSARRRGGPRRDPARLLATAGHGGATRNGRCASGPVHRRLGTTNGIGSEVEPQAA